MTNRIVGLASRVTAAAAPRKRGARERERLLAVAALYRLIARGFSYPEPELVCSVRRNALDLAAAATSGELVSAPAPALRALGRAWRTASAQGLTTEYSRLFLGAGLVPLREGSYGNGLRFAGQPIDIADLNGFYLAFGFSPSETAPNPPDHLGTEIEFVSLLHLKKAHALERGKVREARIVDHALGRFLEDHLGRWIPSLDTALRESEATSPYALLAEVMKRAVAAECTRLGAKPLLARPGTANDTVAGDALVCPLATAEPVSERARNEP
ncbi:MAG: molecular chaperone [Hyphomicrobiaceae bacterium]